MNPIVFKSDENLEVQSKGNALVRTNEQMLQFDFNRNPITLKCRLYIIKALLFRAWDQSGKADPYIKIFLNNEMITDDVTQRLYNTLEPIFGKSVTVAMKRDPYICLFSHPSRSYEFEVTVPQKSLLRIQVWDWDLANVNDKIAETSIDIENRWFSCHRATCGLPKRYDR